MGHDKPSPLSGEPRSRSTLEQRIAHTAIEVSYAAARAEDYSEYLVTQAYLLFGAEEGAGVYRAIPRHATRLLRRCSLEAKCRSSSRCTGEAETSTTPN